MTALPIVFAAGLKPSNCPISFRTPTNGPEDQLVDTFLQHLRIKARTGKAVIVLREPLIDSHYPDLVILDVDMQKLSRWEIMLELPHDALRCYHAIISGLNSIDQIIQVFGPAFSRHTESLLQINAVKVHKGLLEQTRRLPIALDHVIAVEAKTSVSQKVINQAEQNLKFASSSAILAPTCPNCDSCFLDSRTVLISPFSGTNLFALANNQFHASTYLSWQLHCWSLSLLQSEDSYNGFIRGRSRMAAK